MTGLRGQAQYDELVKIRRLLMGCLCLTLGAIGFSPMPAALAADKLEVDVAVTSVSADSLTLSESDSEIKVSGKITNTSDQPMTWVRAEFWLDPEPLRTLPEVTAAPNQDAAVPTGRTLTSLDSGNRMQVTAYQSDGEVEVLESGATRNFEVSATLSELAFKTEGAYRVGVHVYALNHTGDVQLVGINRWLLPVWDGPVDHSTVVELSAPPTMIKPGYFINDDLVTDLKDRIEPLVELAEDPDTTFVLDPLLYDSVAALAAEHKVGEEVAAADQDAAALMVRLDALSASGRGYRLLYGNPDLGLAAQTSSLDRVVEAAQTAMIPEHPLLDMPLAVLGGPDLSEEIMAQLPDLGQQITFAEAITTPGLGAIAITPFPSAGLQPYPSSEPAISGQLLSQDLAANLSGMPVVRVVRTTADLEANRSSGDLVRLKQPVTTPSWGAATQDKVSIEWTMAMSELDKQVNFLASMTTSTEALLTASRVTSASRSQNFDQPQAAEFANELAPTLLPNPVAEVQAQPSFVMADDENLFPINVINHSTYPLTVELVFRSTNPQRLNVPERTQVRVSPGDTETVEVRLIAAGSGVVPINVWLETTTGARVSPPINIEITATHAGWLGWAIIIISGVVVIGSTVWRIRAVQKGKSQSAS